MHMRPNEKIVEKYRHHPFPFFLQMLLMGFASVILYGGVLLFSPDVSGGTLFTIQLVLGIILLLFIAHMALIYWGDSLVLTNYRLIAIDWKFFHWQTEEEVGLHSIQEIETSDKGLLKYIPLFAYGTITIRSEGTAHILFENAPEPDKIKHRILVYAPHIDS